MVQKNNYLFVIKRDSILSRWMKRIIHILKMLINVDQGR